MLSRILPDLKKSYGIHIIRVSPITGGWLNRKWRIETPEGEFLIKQFSNRRFHAVQLALIESALQRQMLLQERGVLCPEIQRCAGRAIRLLDDQTAYMVMEFCPGKVETPDTVTCAQMRSLGRACGQMHAAFLEVPVRGVSGFPTCGRRVIDALWDNFHARVRACTPEDPDEYRKALFASESVLKQLTCAFFDRLPKGIGHEDFSGDIMLFDGARLSAIVDFDRNCYSYFWHDIGRALLSFAWSTDGLNHARIQAFMEGYAAHGTLKLPAVADALRLAWCIETPWWIRPEFFGEAHAKVARFKDEMLWLTRNWSDLDAHIKN